MELIQQRKHLKQAVSLFRLLLILLCGCFFHSSLCADLVEINQLSEPAGFVDQTDIVETGEEFSSISPTLSSNGYVFGYWSHNGTRLTDGQGRSVTKATVAVDGALTLTARYFLEDQDSDQDGISDWFEWRNFGDLNESLSGDYDLDGFTNGQEDMLGQEPTIKDLLEDGGISSRSSVGFVFADTSMVKYAVKSDPIGFVSTTEAFVEQNTTIATPNLHGETNGYQFAYWSMNGIRQASANGVAVSQVIAEVNASATFIAHYIPSVEDNDTDGIMDWFEFYQFGNLNQGPNDDPDYDNFSNAQESALGQEAAVKDLVEDGGISSRSSVGFVFADTSMVKYIVRSAPVGFVNTAEAFVELNATVATPSLHGQTNGYHFAYWTMNGVRQASANGVALSQVVAQIAQPTTFVAHYIPSNDDSDVDGIMDWFELYQFGHLAQGPGDDPDNDNFSNSQESTLGQEATIKDLVEDGGISSRSSVELLYFSQANQAPHDLSLHDTVVFANEEVGEVVGTFIPHDIDDPKNIRPYTFNLVNGEGDDDNQLFQIGGDELQTSAKLALGTYQIRARVYDDENAFLEKSFIVTSIINPDKDDDGDGLSYFREEQLGTSDQNPDSDGDGLNDYLETIYGSDPADSKSLANLAPTDINASSSLTISENELIGTLITNFFVTDPNRLDDHSLVIVNQEYETQVVDFFTLETNGSLRSAKVFDFETDPQEYSIKIRATDSGNSSVEKTFIIQELNHIEDFDGDGLQDHVDDDDDNDGISDLDEIAFGSNPFDPNDAYMVPIIRTLGSALHASDSLLLKGKVPEDQVSKVSEVGFLLSPKIFFDNPQVITLNTIPETGNIELSINPQMYPNGIYFRLFAKNPAGTGFGAIMRFRPNTNQSINKWWGNSETSEEGWQRSDWLGSFLPYENGWMYHLHMGWMFSSAEESDSVWLWTNYQKWLWTSKEVFPFLYRWEDSSWLFAYFHKNGSVHYFNYSTDSYE